MAVEHIGWASPEESLMEEERFLVTGAGGCIGSWILKELQSEGRTCFALDVSTDFTRPRLLMSREQLDEITFLECDVTNGSGILRIIEDNNISHIIHLAGLQVPFCKANPAEGARVNVVGTVNIFEAAGKCRQQIQGLAYASSIAVLGPPERYPDHALSENVGTDPRTLYGVYKQANEAAAKIYWNDFGISSVGLRPYIVYGVARDQGLTSDIAKAILAATVNRPFRIKFGGRAALQYVQDVAQIFIRSALANSSGPAVCNIQNDSVSIEDFIKILKEVIPGARVDSDLSVTLPFPYRLDDSNLASIVGEIPHKSLHEAVSETSLLFRQLVDEGRIDLNQLGSFSEPAAFIGNDSNDESTG
jgi:nucleoside-diphosphate-sugar epimerase